MACGTGKTLVALWAAENVTRAFQPVRIGAQAAKPAPRILVPSLALLGQVLHEWSRKTSWPALAHLCVCSDPAVKSDRDEIILRSSDLDFPVTTDSAQVRAFLAAKFNGVKLVFSTYQSAHVVAAGLPPSTAFDLAIFDEAHKTAEREGVHFGLALAIGICGSKSGSFSPPPRAITTSANATRRATPASSIPWMRRNLRPRRPPTHLRRSRLLRHHLLLPGHHLRGHFGHGE